jgi:O-antigen ligase
MKILVLSAVPGFAALGLWALIDLENFVLFAVLGATIFPVSLGHLGGSNIAIVDVLLVIAVLMWLVANSVGRAPDPAVRRNPLLLPAALFVIWNTISIAWSIHPGKTFAFSIQLFELLIVFPLAFATLPTSVRQLKRALVWLLGLTSILAVVTVVAYVRNHSLQTAPEFLPGYNKNALGAFVGGGLVLGYALFIGSRSARNRVLLVLSMVVCAAALSASASRGAIVGAGAGLLLVALLLSNRKMLGLVLVAVLAVGYVEVAQPSHSQQASHAGGYDSSTVRHWAWVDGWRKIESNPWFGTGGRTYSDVLPQLHGFITGDPDNLFLLTWAELGIPGLLALGFLLFQYLALLWRLRRLPRDASVLAVGAGGVVMSLLVHIQVDVSWSRGETTLEFAMLGVMLAVGRLAAREPVVDAVPESVEPRGIPAPVPVSA